MFSFSYMTWPFGRVAAAVSDTASSSDSVGCETRCLEVATQLQHVHSYQSHELKELNKGCVTTTSCILCLEEARDDNTFIACGYHRWIFS